MPRRRPNAVRAAQQRAKHTAVIPGLSPATCHALNRLDRDELRQDVIGRALRRWQALSKPPLHEIRRPRSSHLGVFTEGEVRDLLQGAVRALPRRGARQLQRLVAPADRRIRRATLPDPTAPPDAPWWHRRLLSGGDATREPLTPPRSPRPQTTAGTCRPWAVTPTSGPGSAQRAQGPPILGVDVHERAKMFASVSLAQGDPTGWFEELYQAERRYEESVPWDRHLPLELLVEWKTGGFGRALVVGCAFGDDAELLASRGHPVTAFDVAPSAVAGARRRFPRSSVDYRVADLLELPSSFDGGFDVVVECRTLQYLPPTVRAHAIAAVTRTVAPGGTLLVISTREDQGVPVNGPPWPLTRADVISFTGHGLDVVRLEDPDVRGMPGWRAEFRQAPRSE